MDGGHGIVTLQCDCPQGLRRILHNIPQLLDPFRTPAPLDFIPHDKGQVGIIPESNAASCRCPRCRRHCPVHRHRRRSDRQPRQPGPLHHRRRRISSHYGTPPGAGERRLERQRGGALDYRPVQAPRGREKRNVVWGVVVWHERVRRPMLGLVDPAVLPEWGVERRGYLLLDRSSAALS
jgi:hypothetical protein